MRKVLAIIRREYVQGVRSKTFLLSTLLAPLLLVFLMIVPTMLMGLKTGGATRLAVVDETGRLYAQVHDSIMRPKTEETDPERKAEKQVRMQRDAEEQFQSRFDVTEVQPAGRPREEIRRELDRRVLARELDAYLILPADILERGRVELYMRNTGDVFSVGVIENRLSRAVIEQRMRDERIDERRVRELSREVRVESSRVTERGTERDSGSSQFFFAVGVGTFILVAVMMYGQAVLSAVVEEKTTRVVEVLFSSVRAFPLMLGKLVGVSLVALTQFVIWAVLLLVLALYGAVALAGVGVEVGLPSIPVSSYAYAVLFFMVGFFLYATLYAVIGSVVTSEKEASQIIVPVSFLPVLAIYLAFPVIRSPSSSFSVWVSMVPFFSPVTMLVRIVTERPPLWQIALSLFLGVATIVLMVWLAARIYRTGMLMYGKRATIPEILRWVRQP
ncbi:MAG TPA: ABC transporter permease [Pyrinomonadaceae bacterium]|jgi:ABC-2 type transport system permease protein|nr:ABC transporter permease [Pyrinomonadaceae bacterium]